MTLRSYLSDSAVSGPARIVDKIEADVPIVRLDRTLFHPNTASQRADRGRIGMAQVLAVEINGAVVDHYVDRTDAMSVGGHVEMLVDSSWRCLQSTYHSAGHLIAYALQEIRSDCTALIGQHWPDHAVITCYAGRSLNVADLERVHDQMRDLIAADLPILAQNRSDARYVTFGDLAPVRCNGTHLVSTGTLSRVHILRHEFDGEYLRLHYVAYNKPHGGKE